jgi:hypothetical protein
VSLQSSILLSHGMHDVLPDEWASAIGPFGGEVIWLSAALALVAIGLGVTRAIREI